MSNKGYTREDVTIMDIDFSNNTKADFLHQHLFPRLLNKTKTFVVTANPEIVMQTREDAGYKNIVQSADYVIPDGAGVILASKFLKQPIKERIPGFDIMLDLLRFAEEEGLSCYFLGAKESVNEKAVTEIKRRYPKLTVAGRHHGYFSIHDRALAEDIASTQPDLIFVALGFPKQEQWINEYMYLFSKGLFMGVGGSFDVLSGEVKRAPEIWIRMNLEWFYRLVKQPFRWKRILKAFEFIVRIFMRRY